MPFIDLRIEVSEATAGLIDALRGSRSREEIVRHLIELGLCEMLEATARSHRDSRIHSFMGQTEDLKIARNNILTVREPKADGKASDDTEPVQSRRYEAINLANARGSRV